MTDKLKFRNHAAERKVIDDANAHMESMFGDLREAKNVPPLAELLRPNKRSVPRGGGDPRNATDIDRVHAKQKPLEQDVVRAIKDLLAAHPKVLWALRVNSGSASYEAKSGKWNPVKFHEWVRSPCTMRMPDFYGMLVDGRALALEAKREGWTKPTDQRERDQAAFLECVRSRGGRAGFVTCVDDALRIIEG